MKTLDFVNSVFDKVANRYDIMNDVMSFGIQRMWKKKFCHIASHHVGRNYMDLATGTGDIVIGIINELNIRLHTTQYPKIIISDVNEQMLDMAKRKIIDSNYIKYIDKFITSEASSIPLEDNTFDLITVAFGIRNFHDIQQSLKEISRLLKKGGKLYCLEFSPELDDQILTKIYRMYCNHIIPKIGKIIVGDADPYHYFVDSIKSFIRRDEFAKMIFDSGFSFVDYESWSQGICCLHVATK